VFAPDGTPRVRVRVRNEVAKGGRAADVFLPVGLVAKLKRFWRWKQDRGEDLAPDGAGFDRVYGLHGLRHSAISSVYRMTRDLYPAQRFARHVSPLTTTVYTHPSDQEMAGRVHGLDC